MLCEQLCTNLQRCMLVLYSFHVKGVYISVVYNRSFNQSLMSDTLRISQGVFGFIHVMLYYNISSSMWTFCTRAYAILKL